VADVVQERLLALYALVWSGDHAAALTLVATMHPRVAQCVLASWAAEAAMRGKDDNEAERARLALADVLRAEA
jgi:hypothetical protein